MIPDCARLPISFGLYPFTLQNRFSQKSQQSPSIAQNRYLAFNCSVAAIFHSSFLSIPFIAHLSPYWTIQSDHLSISRDLPRNHGVLLAMKHSEPFPILFIYYQFFLKRSH
jgi:hypothetical protein